MPEITERIANFSPEKLRQLARRLNKKEGATLKITRCSRESNAFPLSFGQERLWFLDQLTPGNTAYNLPFAFRFRLVPQLDPGRGPDDPFQNMAGRVIDELVRRHEILRTSFPGPDGSPIQQVAPASPVPLKIIDLPGLPEDEREAAAKRLILEDGQKPFDLSHGPLCRFGLIRFAPDDTVTFGTMHHILVDGWSQKIFLQEVRFLFFSLLQGRSFLLPELSIQYADYAVWQRQWLQGEVWERLRAYWTHQLKGLQDLELRTDYPRPAVESFKGASESLLIPSALCDRLRRVGQSQGCTPFMTLLAAWATLMMRYSGQSDVAVCTPVANRTRVETELLIGFFVNTLVIRIDLSGNPTFLELLKRVREVCTEAYAHQEMPFEKLVQEVQPSRDLGGNPLSRIAFQLMDIPTFADAAGRESSASEPSITPLEVEPTTSMFDLNFTLSEPWDSLLLRRAKGIRGVLAYRIDLFEAATVRRMLGHYQNLLLAAGNSPQRRLSDLDLLDGAEREQLLVEWNATTRDYGSPVSVHGLFEAQVERTPHAVAVIGEGQQLTYRELSQRTNQLGWYLREQGVGPDVRVGICAERSMEMVVGLLGILKAGGAYVPLDPDYPDARLKFMVADTQPALLLIQEAMQARLRPLGAARMLCLDRDWALIAERPITDVPRCGTAENLAYVIYTSGSTGQPKGVMIPHRGIVNRLMWMQEQYQLTHEDRVLQKTPFSFDVSVWEFFWPLLAGAALVICQPRRHGDSEYLIDLIARERVTTLHFVPSMLSQFLEDQGVQKCVSVRQVICSGEALPASVVERFFRCMKAELHNLYGPTEASVDVTYWKCRQGEGDRAVPIGHPIANTQIYVLDESLNPVPVGVQGDLYIGGTGVGRGYQNRPELTAEKFIPDNFGTQAGQRFYKTGDLALFRADGSVEFLGRSDFQVKLRGFRIECGEIEAALLELPQVQQAAVIARQRNGDLSLLAYVICSAQADTSGRGLREQLAKRLPEYMIPSRVTLLERMPLTSSGKVDRQALPDPELSSESSQAFVAPRTPVEHQLAEIWSEILGAGRIGIHDSFFDTGGHSLLATRVISRVRRAFKVDMPLRTLFEAPTIAGLAEKIESALNLHTSIQPSIRRAPRHNGSPLSFAQQRLWFLDQFQTNAGAYNVPGAVEIHGALEASALKKSLEEIVRRHEVLRTCFVTREGEPMQQVGEPGPVPLPLLNLTSLTSSEQQTRLHLFLGEQAQQPFDLGCGPLLRANLIRLGADEHVLALNLHHIVSDGWSMGVLLNELGQLYEAFLQNKPSPLPELPIQYADFSVWQREWLQGEVLETELSYWRKQLAGLPELLELPTDHARPAIERFGGSRLTHLVPMDLTEQLKRLSREQNVTLFMTLLAVFQVLLQRYSGEKDLAVGTPIANRERVEIEGLIGFFVNTLVLRAGLHGNPTFSELLARVRETALGAYAHQDMPFEKLVEELRPKRSTGHAPLFQVMFTLQNAPLGELTSGGSRLTQVEVETVSVKFDLMLTVEEIAQGMRLHMDYRTDLFEATTMQRLLGHYQNLLYAVVGNPGRRLWELDLLNGAEREQLLVEWNATSRDYGPPVCMHELVEAQVERTPEAVAVICEGRQLSYTALNRRANQMAHRLRELGVGPEKRVAVCLERGLDMVVSLLAVLKAGGAYVPLDVKYPPARLRWMLEDSQAVVVITQERLLGNVEGCVGRLLCLEEEESVLAAAVDENPEPSARPENLAYLIYTSGSTGRPKGVAIEHASAATLIHWARGAFAPEQLACVLASTSICFDLSIFEIFVPLSWGHRVMLVENVLRLPELAADAGVTLVNTVPSAMTELLRMGPLPSSVNTVALAGEPLSNSLVQQIYQQPGVGAVLNLYGPSEDTTYSTWAQLPKGSTGATPIGRPLANTQVFVLDEQLQPVPYGVTGQLYLGGSGLARCYLDRPDLTAERFTPNPFSPKPGARMYATGDQACWRADGNLEYLGRLDHQVKIRGFRIECGEIEALLATHPRVNEAAVVVSRQENDTRLLAYVVCLPKSTTHGHELRQYLRDRLPEYMVPGSVVLMEQMPLTPNGKLDRQALIAAGGNTSRPQAAFVGPRDVVELELIQIWEEFMDIRPIGIRDNFFDLGGHSLLAVRLMARIRASFGQTLPLMALFLAPDVEQLAQRLRQCTKQEKRSPLVLIQTGSQSTPLFMVHPIGGQVLCYYELSRHLGPKQTVYGLEATASDETTGVSSSIEQMASGYVEAIQAVQPSGPYLLGGWSIGGIVAFEMAQRLRVAGHEVEFLAIIDSPAPRENKADTNAAASRSLASIARIYEIYTGRQLGVSEDVLNELNRAEQLDFVLAEMKNKDLAPPDVDVSYLREFLQVAESNLRAKWNYVPADYSGRIILFRSQELIPGFEEDQDHESYPEPAWGWGQLSAEPVVVHSIPGNHVTMLNRPNVLVLARVLKEYLGREQGG
jgi:amino acid adenylation domain-containing protein